MTDRIATDTDGGITVITLDRPSVRNALGTVELQALAAALTDADRDRSINALIVTGAAPAFSAGADIAELVAMSDAATFRSYLDLFQSTLNHLEEMPILTVAAMNGSAYGGGLELALACDLRVLALDAAVGLPEIRIGALPGAGGTQRLARSLPAAIYKRMVLLGDALSAEDCARFGLVNTVVPVDDVVPTAREWARAACALPPRALTAAKALASVAGSGDLKAGMEVERMTVTALFDTADRIEGMRAFLDKRPPTFHGR